MTEFRYNPPMDPYLEILYQDEDLLFLNKPAELLSVPGRAAEHWDSLATRVQRVYPNARVVHRLDMATSGLIVMAMHAESHKALNRQFSERQVEKLYYAWVSGEVAKTDGEVNLPLRCDWPNRPRQMVDHELGKKALTRWRRVGIKDGNSLMELKPVTGRSHQLRVHMQAIGHPILGDRLYAKGPALDNYDRLHLHAAVLTLTHPYRQSTLMIKAPVAFELLDDQGPMDNRDAAVGSDHSR
ncbi:pseudouridine synthase [Dongshaea marina]|uniref:pseudouridine synthase n=1 Tax=Dongshaea marina TaxID=2047966 RepID=UPI000D3E8314